MRRRGERELRRAEARGRRGHGQWAMGGGRCAVGDEVMGNWGTIMHTASRKGRGMEKRREEREPSWLITCAQEHGRRGDQQEIRRCAVCAVCGVRWAMGDGVMG